MNINVADLYNLFYKTFFALNFGKNYFIKKKTESVFLVIDFNILF